METIEKLQEEVSELRDKLAGLCDCLSDLGLKKTIDFDEFKPDEDYSLDDEPEDVEVDPL